MVPTVLAYRGLQIEDIGGDGEFVPPGRENRYYRNNWLDKSLTPGTFVFRPPMPEPGAEPDYVVAPSEGYGPSHLGSSRGTTVSVAVSAARLTQALAGSPVRKQCRERACKVVVFSNLC